MHWNWRLRSPNSGNANNVRNVNSDGSENNNNAYNGNVGVLPLRWIYRDRVARAAKAEAHHQRKAYPIQRKEDKHIAPTPGTTQLRGAGAASGASPLWAKTTKEYVNGETCTTRI